MRKRELKKRLSLAVILVTALSMLSCIAAVPIIVMKVREANQSKLTAEMPAPPEKVFNMAVEMAEEKNVQILKKEEDKRYLEVTDGVQTASLKAEESGTYNSKVTVITSIKTEEEKEKKKEQEQELGQRIMNRLCERLKVQCTIEQK
ncbi:MAG TPA: hypothetical protein VFG09_02005 [Thermodesulfovibrionales bacterium]|jgi:hypothetical protein|nr:hypothetical protein [Thermodesulfovibrionales bacterium]